MTTQPFDVGPERPTELTARERFAGRTAVTDEQPPEEEAPQRLVPLRAVTDFTAGALIAAGLALGVVAAWMAGGKVPGLATLAGALIALGVLLTL